MRVRFGGGNTDVFCKEPSEVGVNDRFRYISLKTKDGCLKRKIAQYCYILKVSRRGFYGYLKNRNNPYKYQDLLNEMLAILAEDEYNDAYGRVRMYQALEFRKEQGKTNIHIPSENTVRSVMIENNLIHKPYRNPNGITKADKNARKSDDKLKRDFYSDIPNKKAIPTLLRFLQRTENVMFQQLSTALTNLFWVYQFPII